MTISFTAVARSKTIIASYSSDGNDLTRDVQKLLETPFVKNEQRRTRNYLFTFYKSPTLNFICACPLDVDRQAPLTYLDTLSNRWNATVGEKSLTAGPNSLSQECRTLFEATLSEYNSAISKAEKIKKDLDQTQKIMTDSVHSALNRGEELQSISLKSEDLLNMSEDFRNQASNLKNKMFWSWVKSKGIIILIVLIILYIVLTFICGGWTLRPRCL